MNRILLPFAFVVMISCDQESAWDCVQKQGKQVVTNPQFSATIFEIHLFDDLNLELRNANGNGQEIFLLAGENLVPEIKFHLEAGILSVRNHNSCRWTRPSKNVTLVVVTDTLQVIQKRGYGDIMSTDSLHFSFRLRSFVPGEINLSLDNHAIGLELLALNNVTLSGRITHAGYFVNGGEDGIIRAENLIAENVEIVHDGFNGIHVNVTTTLSYYIRNSGNIYLHGDPLNVIQVEKTGSGQLIQLN